MISFCFHIERHTKWVHLGNSAGLLKSCHTPIKILVLSLPCSFYCVPTLHAALVCAMLPNFVTLKWHSFPRGTPERYSDFNEAVRFQRNKSIFIVFCAFKKLIKNNNDSINAGLPTSPYGNMNLTPFWSPSTFCWKHLDIDSFQWERQPKNNEAEEEDGPLRQIRSYCKWGKTAPPVS